MRHAKPNFYKTPVLWFIITVAITGIALDGNESRAHNTVSVTQEPVEISVTLKTTGFDPGEVLIPAHRFQLSLDNRTGIKELVLRLSTVDGIQVREMHVSGAGGDWSETFDLQPGKYILSEASHNNWLCTFKVRP